MTWFTVPRWPSLNCFGVLVACSKSLLINSLVSRALGNQVPRTHEVSVHGRGDLLFDHPVPSCAGDSAAAARRRSWRGHSKAVAPCGDSLLWKSSQAGSSESRLCNVPE